MWSNKNRFTIHNDNENNKNFKLVKSIPCQIIKLWEKINKKKLLKLRFFRKQSLWINVKIY